MGEKKKKRKGRRGKEGKGKEGRKKEKGERGKKTVLKNVLRVLSASSISLEMGNPQQRLLSPSIDSCKGTA